jgi:hypothetical protein
MLVYQYSVWWGVFLIRMDNYGRITVVNFLL